MGLKNASCATATSGGVAPLDLSADWIWICERARQHPALGRTQTGRLSRWARRPARGSHGLSPLHVARETERIVRRAVLAAGMRRREVKAAGLQASGVPFAALSRREVGAPPQTKVAHPPQKSSLEHVLAGGSCATDAVAVVSNRTLAMATATFMAIPQHS
jgi:hypothetical protein